MLVGGDNVVWHGMCVKCGVVCVCVVWCVSVCVKCGVVCECV